MMHTDIKSVAMKHHHRHHPRHHHRPRRHRPRRACGLAVRSMRQAAQLT
jgi:hypothetical protein